MQGGEVGRGRCQLTPARGRGESMSVDRRASAGGMGPLVAALLAAACTHPAPHPRTAPVPAPDSSRASAHEADLDQRVARLERRLLEREGQIDELEERLDDTRQEGARAMG